MGEPSRRPSGGGGGGGGGKSTPASPQNAQLGSMQAGGRNVGPVGPGAMGQGANPFEALSGLTSSGLRGMLSTGNPTALEGIFNSIRQGANQRLGDASADMTQRMGGLGYRFSTNLMDQQRLLTERSQNDLNSVLAPLQYQAGEGAAGRQLGALQHAFNLPGQLQNMAGQGYQQYLTPFQNLQAFGTGFAPVGGQGKSKNASLGLG